MSDALVLVLDLGTHKCRAVVMDRRGAVAARATSPPYPTHREQPGWAEQEPPDWWDAALSCVRDVLRQVKESDIDALVPVGHGPSHLPLDEGGRPLRRALIWQDTRARDEAAWIAEHTTVDERFRALGLHLPIAPGMGPARFLWLRDKEPETYARTAVMVQPKDYLLLRLTGEVVSDRYGLKDLVHAHTGVFDPWYAETLGLRRSLIPRMLTPWSLVGHTNAEQAKETGLRPGLPVACGTIDAFAGLIGSGGQDDGEVCDVSGTSEIVGLMRHAPAQPFEGFLCYPLVGGRSVTFGVTRAAGDSIDWFVRKIARADDFETWIRAFQERETHHVQGRDTRSVSQKEDRPRSGPQEWETHHVQGRDTRSVSQEEDRPRSGPQEWETHHVQGGDTRSVSQKEDRPRSGPVLFWPYLDGERSPIWEADARGVFLGLDLETDVDTLGRAVLEGVAFSVRHNLDLLERRTGTKPVRMWVGGGTARIGLLNQIKADVTGLDVLVPEEYEATARGAVAMARVALGEAPDVLTAARSLVGEPKRLTPRPVWREHYERLLPIYSSLAETLRPAYRDLAKARAAYPPR